MIMKTLEALKATFESCVQETILCDLALDKLELEEDAWRKMHGKYTKEQRVYIGEKEDSFKQKKTKLWEEIEEVFKQMIDIQPDYILKLLQKYHEEQNFDALDIIIEYMRMCWYPTTPQNTIETIILSKKLILGVAIDLLDSEYLASNKKVMWFVKQAYDIFFHQCGIGGEATELTDLFLKLSLKILDPKYYALRENETTNYSYSSSIYFMGLLHHYIEDRPHDFFALWEKMQLKPIYWLHEVDRGWWIDSYERLTSPDKALPTKEA